MSKELRIVVCQDGKKAYVKKVCMEYILESVVNGNIKFFVELDNIIVVYEKDCSIVREDKRIGLKGSFFFTSCSLTTFASLSDSEIEYIGKILLKEDIQF